MCFDSGLVEGLDFGFGVVRVEEGLGWRLLGGDSALVLHLYLFEGLVDYDC